MEKNTFSGKPYEIGMQCGKKFAEGIRRNLSILVWREGLPPLPHDEDFRKWVDEQEAVISRFWPWLLEEFHGVTETVRCDYRDILLLNLAAWQYDFYSGKTVSHAAGCSSLVITLADGTVANTGALDDGIQYYCGMVRIIPDHGYSYMTFPITGTSWGNRGINSAGLCIGESSQIIPGLKRLSGSICPDIALRVILQTCETVDDVRNFCREHPFTLNLVCSDKYGGVFCAHQTTAGLFELSERTPWAISNHVIDDMIMFKLSQQGAIEFGENGKDTTRLRRGRLMDFALRNNGIIINEDVKKFIAARLLGAPESACPKGNVVLTYANSQAEPGILWIAEPSVCGNEIWKAYNI